MITGIYSDKNATPSRFSLSQNYPNPFNPSTVIQFNLSSSGFATLKVYDVLGRKVKTLVNNVEQPGDHSVTFNAERLPSGVYFYRLQAAAYSQTRKLLLLK